ncbi:hypothetical protein [Pseudonocardia acaciae]|uniref:hypothetical protein n=1 Tax=Pseudonocardia acaciae TaxID=551276 RepID=UPI00048D1967|nr:hypothetical protein [Pseudonocardia acaciae]
MADQDPASAVRLTFGLLLDMTDYHVHAVYDPEDPCPLTVCGEHLIPGIFVPGPALLHRGCLAAIPDPDTVELRPASAVRRRLLNADPDHAAGPILKLTRWYLAARYDQRIRRAITAEWRRG